MKNIKQYNDFLNEDLSVNKITGDDLEKLFNDEEIIINNTSIKNGENIESYNLIRIAQGATININDTNINMMLEDDIDFKIIKNIVRKSPLNIDGSLFGMFMETHPMRANQ